MEALEKINRINLLFDFYEPLLTKKQQLVLRYYYYDNFSLGEISDLVHTSRQAVFEHIKRAEQTLEDYEKKLGLVRKHEAKKKAVEQLKERLSLYPDLSTQLAPLLAKIEQME